MAEGLFDTALGALRLALLFTAGLFLPVILQLLLLFGVSRIFLRLAELVLHRGVYFLALVGVPVHELSHALALLVTFSGLNSIALLPDPATGVAPTTYSRPNSLGDVLSSLAPLFGCTLVLWLAARYIVPGFELSTVAPPLLDPQDAASPGTLIEASLDYLGQVLKTAYSSLPALEWGNWRTYLGLYVALSVGMAIAPSTQDLKNMLGGLPFFLFLILGLFVWLYLSGDAEQVFLTLQQKLQPFLQGLTSAITYAFVLTSLGALILAPFRLWQRMSEREAVSRPE